MLRKYKFLLPALVALLCIAGFFLLRYWNDHKNSNFSREYVLYVTPKMTEDSVLDSLKKGAGVKNMRGLERCFDELEVETRLVPGKYVIKPEYSSIYVARMLVKGWTSPQNLTLSGTIRTKESLAKKISSQMMVDSASVAQALTDADFLDTYGFTPETVFAMFLPDTYQVQWSDSVRDIFDRFKKEYDKFWDPKRLGKAEALRMTPFEVSVMASIVNAETNTSSEYKTIAGVYLNRYRKGMKLQADPTVAFCFDYKLDRILKKHLAVDSPYNTYKYKGLPPAPINVPPKACIDAVLNPQVHEYIYFCASPDFDGTHRFAVGYNEHLKNAREFQRALTARRK